jgi:RNA polymerase sigma factor (sigma-70 family)
MAKFYKNGVFHLSDKQLERFKKGDEVIYSMIYHEFNKKLIYYAFSIIKKKDLAEDAVTEALIKLWQLKEQFDTLSKISAFLYITTRNKCIDELNHLNVLKRNQQPLVYSLQTIDDKLEQEENKKIYAEILDRIYKVEIEKLPESSRVVFTMYYLDGHSIEDIAKVLSLEPKTILNKKRQALLAIKSAQKWRDLLIFCLALLLDNISV